MKKAFFKELAFDEYTPITAYQALASKGACLLESSPNQDRFSFIGIDPMVSVSGKGDYCSAIRKLRQEHPIEAIHPLALYAGGCIGYVTYEGEYFCQIYRSGLCFDHQLQRVVIFHIGEEKELELVCQKLNLNKEKKRTEARLEIGPISTDKSDDDFLHMVEKAKTHLKAGDAFQIVLSRTFKTKFKGEEPFQIYLALRKASPAPYLFFFDLEQFAIAGASPEKLISVNGHTIESSPIAGTRPKGASISELLNDPKETAEHVMLVDLARNDLGAVSMPGSVKVVEFKSVHEFSHVTHIVSRVTGVLDSHFDVLDAFKASFPAGTLSGAPKIRAMELIDKIEQSKRGLYGGAILVIDNKGNLTSCIVIRTAIIQDGEISVRAGAGIVLDSDPIKEATETRIKASTVLEAVKCF